MWQLFWIPSRSFTVTWQKGSSPFRNSGLLTLQQNMKVPALPLGGLHGPIPKRSLDSMSISMRKMDDIILPHLLRNTNLIILFKFISWMFCNHIWMPTSISNTSFLYTFAGLSNFHFFHRRRSSNKKASPSSSRLPCSPTCEKCSRMLKYRWGGSGRILFLSIDNYHLNIHTWHSNTWQLCSEKDSNGMCLWKEVPVRPPCQKPLLSKESNPFESIWKSHYVYVCVSFLPIFSGFIFGTCTFFQKTEQP